MTDQYRLAVVQIEGQSAPVVEHAGHMLPLADILPGGEGKALGDLLPLLQKWGESERIISAYVDANLSRFSSEGLSAGSVRFLSPIQAPGKIVCIGSNFHDHIAEMPIPMVPTYPYSFLKPANNTIRASGEPVAVPRRSSMMDWEAELAVVIGKECADVPASGALDVIAGYANFNDLSARDWLDKRPPVGVDWVQHKAFDGFAPFGPYIVPARFVPDPQDLQMRLSVNGVTKQDSNTREMVFGVAAIIEHISSIMTLYPGDIIATGTPAGTGHGRGEYLKSGDTIVMQVGPLGELVTPIA
ncbi:fumarylacetoacetate hydrolase family protein [Sphingobium phenoxybenzoativorans]|uniref:Fumarylacetoacetate hydrolase family protein n=1 Tax=Sphingobium phenoxybenzoativorans TaxID=1592790 RepID=A0A975K4E6_9SPHN|nr:fumarylacetoacetate hydrolase family protein [Sphingobium phenoxybenzoativorans]QUT04628.1 fumarylacetoacetate hydrolase family protein [Sphingobium phenoxybenzoativorans]